MVTNVSKSIEEGKWTSVHTLYFISFAIGLFIEGFLFTVTSYATTWYVIPKSLSVLLLGWSFIWLIIGISFIGPISDRLGRKRTWIYTMALYAVGGVMLVISTNYVLVLISMAILLFAAGGEMNVILIMAHEMFPRRHRSKSVMLLNDFNGGVAPIIAGALGFIAASYTVVFERYLAVLTIFVGLIALLIIRFRTPESIRWLEKEGKVERAEEEKEKYFKYDEQPVQSHDDPSATQNNHVMSIWKRLLILIPIGWANTAGYGLITYTLGPIYFSNVIDYIFLFTGIGAFAGGLLGLFGDRLSRKTLIFSTYWIVTVITVIVVATLGIWSKSITIFWVLLIVLNFVEQLSYATIETMKGEVWPTNMRGSLTAMARVLPLLLYLPVLYFATLLPVSEYLIFNVIIWVIGSVGATAWFIWGHETGKGVSIGKASGES
ncbi:MAG: MFS transporter [Conexivisphaerales archaeon]